ncbi:hypothetical protein B5X24_HaOG213337 [Helicoverpa armigera]|nr:hypothetical protein B5X24_HaOG213337 [Helicoverpa armigera]
MNGMEFMFKKMKYMKINNQIRFMTECRKRYEATFSINTAIVAFLLQMWSTFLTFQFCVLMILCGCNGL